jgi:hypothetical protein
MTKEMVILGINKMEGLVNYLYHPEKVYVIEKDTGKLIPRVELERHVKEEMAKERLKKESWQKKKREKNREKRLAKKKRLAKEK